MDKYKAITIIGIWVSVAIVGLANPEATMVLGAFALLLSLRIMNE